MASPGRRAPENELNHGADMTLGTQQMDDRFSEAYARAFEVPLLDHNFYRNLLIKNFRPYGYAQLAAEFPCIVVRTPPGGGRILKPWICPSGRPMHPNWSPSSAYRL